MFPGLVILIKLALRSSSSEKIGEEVYLIAIYFLKCTNPFRGGTKFLYDVEVLIPVLLSPPYKVGNRDQSRFFSS